MVIPTQGRDAVVKISLEGPRPAVVAQMAFTAEQCTLPHQVKRGPNGLYYLVCEGRHDRTTQENGTVLALNPDDLSVVARYTVGPFPDAITFVGGTR
jgi:hypothetical protein